MGTVWKTIKNPSLADLIGYSIRYGDEAKRRGTQKVFLKEKLTLRLKS
jgi:hypothetical protein